MSATGSSPWITSQKTRCASAPRSLQQSSYARTRRTPTSGVPCSKLDTRSSGRQSPCRPGKLEKTSFTGKCYKQRETDRLRNGSRKELCPSAALSTLVPLCSTRGSRSTCILQVVCESVHDSILDDSLPLVRVPWKIRNTPRALPCKNL